MGMPSLARRIVGAIDGFTNFFGMVVSWLTVPMVLCLVYEVAARYLFRAPTVWAYDLTFMFYGTLFMLGAAFTLQRDGHIRTDVFYDKWSPRVRGWVDTICYVFVFFPAFAVFAWVGWGYFIRSFAQGERIVTSPWMPIVYPFKFVIPLTAALLLLQGVSQLLKSVHLARRGEPL
jgi:TRAP-type mannitol/chloroaromatic compound transport system permease small subunit